MLPCLKPLLVVLKVALGKEWRLLCRWCISRVLAYRSPAHNQERVACFYSPQRGCQREGKDTKQIYSVDPILKMDSIERDSVPEAYTFQQHLDNAFESGKQTGEPALTSVQTALNAFWSQEQYRLILLPTVHCADIPGWVCWSLEHVLFQMISSIRSKIGVRRLKWSGSLFYLSKSLAKGDTNRIESEEKSGLWEQGDVSKDLDNPKWKVVGASMPLATFRSSLLAVSILRTELYEESCSAHILNPNYQHLAVAVTGTCETVKVVQVFM